MKRVTRSSGRSLPCRASNMTAVTVASGLVRDDRSKTVSRAIGVRSGRRLRDPNASWYSTSPRCATRITAPGNAPAPTASAMTAATLSNPRGAGVGSVILSDHRRLERGEPAQVDVELHLHAEGQGNVLHVDGRRRVACGHAQSDGIRRIGEGFADDVERAEAIESPAGFHGAEDHAGDPIELAGLPQLGEQPIEAIGPLVDVLEEHDRAV